MNPDSSSDVNPSPAGALPAVRQGRSRITAERFVEAALDLLQTRTFDELSVGELAQRAGRSVGAFYQRFGSKDDFLASLLTTYMAGRERSVEELLAAGRDEGVLETILADNYAALSRNRNLWHAALRKSARNPGFWSQFQGFIQRRPLIMAARLGEIRGRPLEPDELYRLKIALQVFNSVINNQMMNNPGPLTLASPEFLPTLLGVFRAVRAAPISPPAASSEDL